MIKWQWLKVLQRLEVAVIKNNRIMKCLLMMVVSLLLVLNFSIGVSASSGYDRQEAGACITISQRLSVKGGSYSIPTEKQMHDAVSEWIKMEEKLANSNRQLNKFNTATVAYDAATGNYYYGMNRGIQISGDSLNSSLMSWLPKSFLNQYRLGNCAEVDAVNQALNAGADINNLYLYTINTKINLPKSMCENCVYTFKNRVAEVLSH